MAKKGQQRTPLLHHHRPRCVPRRFRSPSLQFPDARSHHQPEDRAASHEDPSFFRILFAHVVASIQRHNIPRTICSCCLNVLTSRRICLRRHREDHVAESRGKRGGSPRGLRSGRGEGSGGSRACHGGSHRGGGASLQRYARNGRTPALSPLPCRAKHLGWFAVFTRPR